MAVTRASKETELQELERAFKGTESAIVVDFRGLKVPEVTELRRQVRGARGQYKVVKNTSPPGDQSYAVSPRSRSLRRQTAVAYSATPCGAREGAEQRSRRPRGLQIKAGCAR